MHRRNLTSKVSKRKVPEHVKIWEEFMEVEVPFDDEGRRCVIHHLDQNPSNNDIHNLVCMTKSEHQRWHMNNMTDEHRLKLCISKKGKKLSKEHKDKIRNWNLGRKRKKKSPIRGLYITKIWGLGR